MNIHLDIFVKKWDWINKLDDKKALTRVNKDV